MGWMGVEGPAVWRPKEPALEPMEGPAVWERPKEPALEPMEGPAVWEPWEWRWSRFERWPAVGGVLSAVLEY